MWYNVILRVKPEEFHSTTQRVQYPYTLETSSTADLYNDATTQTLGSASPTTALYFAMQLGCIFIHSRVYEISRVHGFCTSCFSFEVWLHRFIVQNTMYIILYLLLTLNLHGDNRLLQSQHYHNYFCQL